MHVAGISAVTDSQGLIREEIYRSLRAEILNCSLRPGIELRENDLADRFSVSKSPVRDALLRLESDRLVVVLPRRGYRVMPISIADARELLEFRIVIETSCARAAAQHATKEQLAELDRFRDFGAGLGEDEFVEYNHDFHRAVTRLSGNRRMADISRGLVEEYERLVRVSMSMVPARDWRGLVAEHCAIIDALQARDGRRAAKLVAGHVERAQKRVFAALAATEVVP
jgi:GntR family transcriptional regulator, rspAB operon transcriptional repressor